MTDQQVNDLYEAGCDDGTFGSVNGDAYGAFDRRAKSLHEAIVSAIKQVNSVDGLQVLGFRA